MTTKQPTNCCICGEKIVGEKRLYLNCNDVPGDPHCHSCNDGEGCLLEIGSGCAKKFKGKVKEVE